MDEEPRKVSVVENTARVAIEAISFDKVVVSGIALLLLVIVGLAFVLARGDKELTNVVLDFYKMTGSAVVGGLLNSVRHRVQDKRKDD